MQTRLSPWSVAIPLQTFLSFRGLGKPAGTVPGSDRGDGGWWEVRPGIRRAGTVAHALQGAQTASNAKTFGPLAHRAPSAARASVRSLTPQRADSAWCRRWDSNPHA